MTPDEARDLARLGARAAFGVAGLVEHTHHGVTERVYRAVGVLTGGASRPVHVLHDLAARHTFFWVRKGVSAAGRLAAALSPHAARDGQTALAGVRAQLALGIVNGVTGHRLAEDGSSLAIPMSLRLDGQDVAATPEELAAAYGTERGAEPGPARVVVFLHGLVETEHAWRFRSRQRWGQAETSYASLLAQETDWRPVQVRYNSGEPIAANAEALGTLLGDLVRGFPGGVGELVVVGHSMGGLVALHALGHGDPAWTRVVRAVVTIGSPREGAPLERFAVLAEEVAEASGSGRWFGGLVGMRSDGIRDLRHPVAHPPLPPWVQEYAVLATLTPDSWHPAVPRVGDGLVPVPADPSEHTVLVAGMHHLDLLNHPAVYAQLRTWLDPGST